MIGWEDVYKVVAAMAPLYVALVLGYGSVRWWRMFKPDQCDAVNRFNCFFVIPFFNFEFMAHINPYKLNFLFLSADVIAKAFIVAAVVFWANCAKNGSLSWSITTLSLSTLNNTLVVGVPLMKAMFGDVGAELVVQAAVVQSLLWLTFLLFGLEFRRTRNLHGSSVEVGRNVVGGGDDDTTPDDDEISDVVTDTTSFSSLSRAVFFKLAKNPNSYACFLGLFWALLAKRWHLQMPRIIEGSILIMSKAGSGVAMFTIGLFMALQENIISCGVGVTFFAMILRFMIGPTTMAIGSYILGLQGNILHIAIIQAALPPALVSFVYAKEYGLHAAVVSTAVIIGTIVSVPLLILYYGILGILH